MTGHSGSTETDQHFGSAAWCDSEDVLVGHLLTLIYILWFLTFHIVRPRPCRLLGGKSRAAEPDVVSAVSINTSPQHEHVDTPGRTFSCHRVVFPWVFWPENLKNTMTSRHSHIYISGPHSGSFLSISASFMGKLGWCSFWGKQSRVICHPCNQEMEEKLVLAVSERVADTLRVADEGRVLSTWHV